MAKIKAGLLSLRDLFATAWWIFLIVGIGFVVAYQFVQPAPPKRIVITTGGESGAYSSSPSATPPSWRATASRWKSSRRPVRWKTSTA